MSDDERLTRYLAGVREYRWAGAEETTEVINFALAFKRSVLFHRKALGFGEGDRLAAGRFAEQALGTQLTRRSCWTLPNRSG